MLLGVIGLGKMGANIAQNLHEQGIELWGFDASETAREEVKKTGIPVCDTLAEGLALFESKKILFLSIPAGEITNSFVRKLCPMLSPGDVIIDGGNSYYKDSLENYRFAKENDIGFLDCGTSGGMEGARYGACLMVGGDKADFDACESIFAKLACLNGYLYTGKAGSGHYLKMIHNGIEYGMMEAIGEGFDLLEACEYDYNNEKVADLWNHGSVIRSWLMELAKDGFACDPHLEKIRGKIDASGEAKWTIEEALQLEIPAPVIASSLFVRNESKIDDSFSAKVVASLRNGFGGHAVAKK